MKVSIIIPYKTDRGFLQDAINSIDNQTYKNTELILSCSDNNVGYNINRGVERSTGDFIKILCDDDLLTENSIQDLVNNIGDADFIHGNAINFFNSGDSDQLHIPRIERPTFSDILTKGNQIHGGTVMYRKSSIDKYGFFDEGLWTGEEFELHLRWLSSGATIEYTNSFVYRYRRWNQQKSLGIRTKQYQTARKKEIDKFREKYTKILNDSSWNGNDNR